MPLISLVALVRDEAADLDRLLRWHRPLYDEAVVVDTGSVDNSAAVAAAHGARVSEFPWRDDFSAARNHGLALARSPYILVLDCDEVVSPGSFAAIRALVADGGELAWTLRQRNYCGSIKDPLWEPVQEADPLAPWAATGFIDVSSCRLFPRAPEVLYEGTVHELPDAALARAGIPQRATDIVIHHYGHLLNKARADIKSDRYARMLRQKLRDQPENPVARHELAVQLVAEGRRDLAKKLLLRTVQEMPEHRAVFRVRLLLGSLLLAEGRQEEGLRQLESAVCAWPHERSGWVAAARAHAGVGNWEMARRFAGQGSKLFPGDTIWQSLTASG